VKIKKSILIKKNNINQANNNKQIEYFKVLINHYKNLPSIILLEIKKYKI
jgi:hypothetical protein